MELKMIYFNIKLVQMKRIILLFGVITGLLLTGCNNPAPTELVQDNTSSQNQVQYQVITKDPTDASYSNGYDTTGVTSVIPPNIYFINISGTKITENNSTRRISFAQALFTDKSRPLMGQGGRLIGYGAAISGMLKFNGITADSTPYRIRFSVKGNILDSLLGSMFVLNNRFNFNYGSQVHIQYYSGHGMHGNPFNPAFDFYIATPQEINGSVKLSGRRANNSLTGEVEWNKLNPADSIDLILGVVSMQGSTFPLFKIRTLDRGRLVIPTKLLNDIPAAKFNKFEFTFIRRIRINQRESGKDMVILSQSIHSIILDIP